MNESAALKSDRVHGLWQQLTETLADIFDAHGVCAILGSQIASFTGTTTVVGIVGAREDYFDVWVCDPDGELQQTRWGRESASFEPLIKSGVPAVFRKTAVDAGSESELWRLAKAAILSAPLPAAGSRGGIVPEGILCLIDPAESCPLDLETVKPLAAHLTVYLERAYLQSQVHRQEIIFGVVTDISYSLTSTLSLERIFQHLMDPVRRTLNVESLSVGLIESVSGDIEFVDILMGPLFSKLPPIRVRKGQGIAGWVAEKRQPIIINDVYADSRFFAQPDQESGFKTESMICIPLQVEQTVIGVLQAINKQIGQFNDSDLRLLQAISGPLAAAIENAKLHADVIAEKRRIETIFSNMSEGLLTVNAEGIVTQANDALLTLVHSSSDKLVGRPANEALHLSAGSLEEFTEKVLAAGEEYPQLATDLYYSHGQSVPVLISGAAVSDGDGGTSETIFVFSDLRQIREVERMRDDFFHGIIHELRTPLATILMYARLLREGRAKEQEKADRFLGVIEHESDRLQKMVRQMLQLAKLEAREFHRSTELVDLNQILKEVLDPLADTAAEKGLVLKQEIEPHLPEIMGSQETLYLIFKNLIDNAIKFTPDGAIRVKGWVRGEQVWIQVKDEGIGIPQESLPNLFGRFFRARSAVERGIAGTGLGLYMVKESVEWLGGTIDVKSPAGKGTTFTVRLPIP